jgi:hypothetical protein
LQSVNVQALQSRVARRRNSSSHRHAPLGLIPSLGCSPLRARRVLLRFGSMADDEQHGRPA